MAENIDFQFPMKKACAADMQRFCKVRALILPSACYISQLQARSIATSGSTPNHHTAKPQQVLGFAPRPPPCCWFPSWLSLEEVGGASKMHRACPSMVTALTVQTPNRTRSMGTQRSSAAWRTTSSSRGSTPPARPRCRSTPPTPPPTTGEHSQSQVLCANGSKSLLVGPITLRGSFVYLLQDP